jgi:hypothetical protein
MEFSIDEFAGIKNTLYPERLNDGFKFDNPGFQREIPPADLTVAENVDFDDSGYLISRDGLELKVSGEFHSLWSDGSTVLVVQNKVLKSVSDTFTLSDIATVQSNNLCYLALNNVIYWSDGVAATGAISNGVNRSWGLPIPRIQSVSSIPGEMFAGRYLLAIAYERNDGQESGVELPVLMTTVDGGGFRVTWDTDSIPLDVDRVILFSSDANGEQLFRVGSVAASIGYMDIRSSLLISNPLKTRYLEKPPACSDLTYFNGRIYMAVGENILATAPYAYEMVDMLDFISVDGTPITMLRAVENGIFVGTQKGITFLGGKDLKDFTSTLVRESPVVKGSAVYADGMKVTGKKELSGLNVVLFTTDDSIMAGLPDGDLFNFTHDKYRFSGGSHAAAAFIDTNVKHQYLVVQQYN